jgi:hypothetical protein
MNNFKETLLRTAEIRQDTACKGQANIAKIDLKK